MLLPGTEGHLSLVYQPRSQAVYLLPHHVRKAEVLHVVEDLADSIGCCRLSTTEDGETRA
jgi:hypothetical protein